MYPTTFFLRVKEIERKLKYFSWVFRIFQSLVPNISFYSYYTNPLKTNKKNRSTYNDPNLHAPSLKPFLKSMLLTGISHLSSFLI